MDEKRTGKKAKLIVCKDCGAEISRSATACPKCGRKTGVRAKGCLASVLIFIGVILFIAGFSGAFGGSSGPSKTPEANSSLMTMSEFNQIETGMTYDETVKIVGGDGEIMSQADVGVGEEYVTAIYTWGGNGGVGSNANVTFQGGKVIAKAQLGLK